MTPLLTVTPSTHAWARAVMSTSIQPLLKLDGRLSVAASLPAKSPPGVVQKLELVRRFQVKEDSDHDCVSARNNRVMDEPLRAPMLGIWSLSLALTSAVPAEMPDVLKRTSERRDAASYASIRVEPP